ncbi:probable mitochondrial import inner membrane translocase subunit TIM21 isoform X2 [Rosa chinensis]|uniref:probable mitochondrial import inner membrane translocase subunit TIM21 isoform X2 n=1 Tax=Rosa chinensis TaxID=74649 RepID=UPI000D087789|nr:probable mitochondrial import inner membrane translocase subunit TIM21 isoform X2 [Rosa chinensis]
MEEKAIRFSWGFAKDFKGLPHPEGNFRSATGNGAVWCCKAVYCSLKSFDQGERIVGTDEISVLSGRNFTRELINTKWAPLQLTRNYGANNVVPRFSRTMSSEASQNPRRNRSETKKDISTVEEPFDDAPTYNIPQKPLTFVEGASYSVVILIGFGIAGLAAYAVFKELIFEPKEYKIFNKALKRIQDDAQVRMRVGYPITGYGQESRNRAARQRIPNRMWTDEDGLEHVEVNFYVRGPHGAGKVFAEMFKDVDKRWKYTYLVVETTSPSQSRLILESYLPDYKPAP